MCKQRGIRLIKLPMKGTELDYANSLKKAFQSVHIFISSDTEEEVTSLSLEEDVSVVCVSFRCSSFSLKLLWSM